MKKGLLIPLVVVLCLLAKAGYTVPMPAERDSLQAWMTWMDLAADGSYGRMMQEFRHPDGRQAPLLLREFLATTEPLKMQFAQGVETDEGTLVFWWEMKDAWFPWSADSLVLLTRQYFREKEYPLAEETSSSVWQLDYSTGFRHISFQLDGIESHGHRSSARVYLALRFGPLNEPLSLKELLSFYPALSVEGLPPALQKLLEKLSFSHLSYGGSWDRYYSWDLRIPAGATDDPAALRLRVIKLIRDYGYVFQRQSEEGSDIFRLVLSDNTRLILLHMEDDGGLSLRFQAYS